MQFSPNDSLNLLSAHTKSKLLWKWLFQGWGPLNRKKACQWGNIRLHHIVIKIFLSRKQAVVGAPLLIYYGQKSPTSHLSIQPYFDLYCMVIIIAVDWKVAGNSLIYFHFEFPCQQGSSLCPVVMYACTRSGKAFSDLVWQVATPFLTSKLVHWKDLGKVYMTSLCMDKLPWRCIHPDTHKIIHHSRD